jgi:hypothetical protein
MAIGYGVRMTANGIAVPLTEAEIRMTLGRRPVPNVLFLGQDEWRYLNDPQEQSQSLVVHCPPPKRV